jgi:1,4-alpha-glucan branching enzyme
MAKKSYSNTGRLCRVTFELPDGIEANTASLVGEFNNWDSNATPMVRRKDGKFTVTVTLKPGEYRYKFLINGERWELDNKAENNVGNPFGTHDSVIKV